MSRETPPDDPLRRWGALIVAFAVGFAGFPLRVVGAGAEYLPGDDIDNPLNNFILEHGYRYLTGRASSFWSAPSFYPQPRVTAWSDAHIGMLPFYAAMRAAGLSPERAFQGHFLLCFVLNYLAAAWALRRLGFGAFGTAAGAYLFAFGLPLAPQLNHTQLFPRFLVPPAVALSWVYLRAPRTRLLVWLAACVVGQIYLSVYVGYFLCLLLAAGFVSCALRFRSELVWREIFGPSRREHVRRLLVLAGAALALVPLAAGHASGVGSPDRGQVRLLAPRPGAWLTPTVASAPYATEESAGAREAVGENQLFPGAVALVAVATGLGLVIRPGAFGTPRAAVAVAAWSALALALLMTRFEWLWLYAPVSHIPGAGGIRATGRVVIVLLFPAGVALAGSVDAVVGWMRRVGKAGALAAGVLAVALVVADNWLASPDGKRAAAWAQMRYPLARLLDRKERLKEAIRSHGEPRLVYVFPSVAEEKRLGSLVVQLEAMRAAQELGLPCVNGWSGYVPKGWEMFAAYRGLIEWLTVTHQTPEEELAGLVVVGEPVPDMDVSFERAMRAKYPPRRLAPP